MFRTERNEVDADAAIPTWIQQEGHNAFKGRNGYSREEMLPAPIGANSSDSTRSCSWAAGWPLTASWKGENGPSSLSIAMEV